MYDTALWKMYKVASLSKLRSCYHKFMKYFLGYNRFYSVSATLLETGLPSFNTILSNCRVVFNKCMYHSAYTIVRAIPQVNGKWRFSDPRGSETAQPMKMKVCTIDYVGELSPHTKFGWRPKRGVFWA